MGVYASSDSLGIALGVDVYRYGFDFNAMPENNVVVVPGGAVDRIRGTACRAFLG